MYGVAYNTTAKTFGTTQPIADNGHRTSDSKGEKINLGLKHAFCLVSLKFKKHTDYAGPCNLTKITYSRPIPTLQTNGTTTMSLKDGALGNLTGAKAGTPVKYEYTVNGGVTVAATTDGIEFINYGVPFLRHCKCYRRYLDRRSRWQGNETRHHYRRWRMVRRK